MNEISRDLCEERSGQSRRRLDNHEHTINELTVCSVKLTELVQIHNDRIKDHETRLDSLESRPASIIARLVDAFISAIVAGVVCLLM